MFQRSFAVLALLVATTSAIADEPSESTKRSLVQSIADGASNQFARLRSMPTWLVNQPAFQWSKSIQMDGPLKKAKADQGKFVISFKTGWLGDLTIEDGPIVGISISISRDCTPKLLPLEIEYDGR